MSARHLERIVWSPNRTRPPNLAAWPFTIPAVAQLVREGGFEVPPGVTFLVGENGSGKSTLVEAFAAIYPREGHATKLGANVVGAVKPPADVEVWSEEDSPLQFHLRAQTNRLASPAGFFLRAEAMHEFLGEEDRASPAKAWGNEKLQRRSHGESFLTVLRYRFEDVGVYFLDEPESALSFHSCLGLVSLLDTLRREGSQVIVATHSPLLVSLPGAMLFEVGEDGLRHVERFDELAIVQHWRQFLGKPESYLRHLFG